MKNIVTSKSLHIDTTFVTFDEFIALSRWTLIYFLVLFIITTVFSSLALAGLGGLAVGVGFILCLIWSLYALVKIVIALMLGWKKIEARKKVSYGYRRSIKEALQTEYPEGIIYILKNTLDQLNVFGVRLTSTLSSGTAKYSIIDFIENLNPAGLVDKLFVQTVVLSLNEFDDTKGFPCRTYLREAIILSKHLSNVWSKFDDVQKIDAMDKIRAKIQTQDIYLDWNKFTLPKERKRTGLYLKKEKGLPIQENSSFIQKIRDKFYKNPFEIEAFWFSYTEEDHRRTPHPQTPIPRPQHPNPTPEPPSPVNLPQILTFEEWVNQNPCVQYYSDKEQREAYERYEQSVQQNSFSNPPQVLNFYEWMKEYPELADKYSTEEEKKEAYLEALKLLLFRGWW